jgi:acyl-CoA synthetase (AMP-forming)/AMP-acid ligase II
MLLEMAAAAAERFRRYPAVLYLGTNHLAYPVALFGAVLAGVPFVPLNYRLGEEQPPVLLARHPGALVLRAGDLDPLLAATRAGKTSAPIGGVVPGESSGGDENSRSPGGQDDDDPVAVVLYTSGTTAAPKAALLRHWHLLAYVWNTVEFGAADESHVALVSVPPYHVAGLANLLTNLYAGRRVVYLPSFSPGQWLETVRRERVTHALLIPTMLARVVAELGDGGVAQVPSLRSLAYGGAGMPRPAWSGRCERSPRPVS